MKLEAHALALILGLGLVVPALAQEETKKEEPAKEEAAKNPFFKKVHDSQRAYASLVVPAKRFMFPPYSFVANYYFPEAKTAAKPAPAKAK